MKLMDTGVLLMDGQVVTVEADGHGGVVDGRTGSHGGDAVILGRFVFKRRGRCGRLGGWLTRVMCGDGWGTGGGGGWCC